jgi:hypothetical protein
MITTQTNIQGRKIQYNNCEIETKLTSKRSKLNINYIFREIS